MGHTESVLVGFLPLLCLYEKEVEPLLPRVVAACADPEALIMGEIMLIADWEVEKKAPTLGKLMDEYISTDKKEEVMATFNRIGFALLKEGFIPDRDIINMYRVSGYTLVIEHGDEEMDYYLDEV